MYNLGLSVDIYEISKAQTHDATYNQEPNDNREVLTKLRSVSSLNAIYCNVFKESETDIYVEESGYTDRAKEPNKDCLATLLDVAN